MLFFLDVGMNFGSDRNRQNNVIWSYLYRKHVIPFQDCHTTFIILTCQGSMILATNKCRNIYLFMGMLVRQVLSLQMQDTINSPIKLLFSNLSRMDSVLHSFNRLFL